MSEAPNPEVSPDPAAPVQAVRTGDPAAGWAAYQTPGTGQDLTQRLASLRVAAEAGHPDAQFELVKLMRGGWVRERDGRLDAVDQAPDQATLDRARALLERAAAGHERAGAMLRNLSPAEWDARTEHRSSFGAGVRPFEPEPGQVSPEGARRLRLVLGVLLLVGLLALLWGATLLFQSRLADKVGAA